MPASPHRASWRRWPICLSLLLLLPAGARAQQGTGTVPPAPAGGAAAPATAAPGTATPPSVTPPAAPEVVPAERRVTHQIAPGIRHIQILREPFGTPIMVNAVRANLKQGGWQVLVRSAQDRQVTPDSTHGRAAVSKIAAGCGALVGTNGDFFPWTGDPIGLEISDGELVSDPYHGRSAFGITRDGRTLWGPVRLEGTLTVGNRSFRLNGINRKRGADEMIAYTPRYAATSNTNASGVEVSVEWLSGPVRPGAEVTGTVAELMVGTGSARIPADGLILSGHGAAAQFLKQASVGDGVSLRIHLVGEDGQSWDDAWQAVGGGPRLIRHGVVCVSGNSEGFASDVVKGRAPRTAVALTRDGELMLVAVDGRQRLLSSGVTLPELAEWLRAEGAVEAMNLDGGGSTTMFLRQVVVNSPSEGTQRSVANALLIALTGQAPQEQGEIAIVPASAGLALADGTPVVPAGTHQRFRVARRLPNGALQELPADAVTWALEGQTGVLGQDGTLLGTRVGTATLVASTGSQVARVKVATVPGTPVAASTALDPGADGQATVRVRAVDSFQNPAAGASVVLSYVTAAGAQEARGVLDTRGEGRLLLPLAALAPDAPATVSVGGSGPVALKLPKRPAPPAAAKPQPEVPAPTGVPEAGEGPQ